MLNYHAEFHVNGTRKEIQIIFIIIICKLFAFLYCPFFENFNQIFVHE